MQNCNINYAANTKKTLTEPKLLTAKLVKKAPVSDKGHLPEDFPNFEKLFEKVKEMVEVNDSCETIKAKFQPAYPYPDSCWLCPIHPKKEGSQNQIDVLYLKISFHLTYQQELFVQAYR